MGLSIHDGRKQQRAQPAFKLTWFGYKGSTGGETWVVLGDVALLAAQPRSPHRELSPDGDKWRPPKA